jgi:hypothetical protein
MYVDGVSTASDDAPCAFVTHNTKDFSDADGDFRKPHADLAYLFEAPRSSYWISMVEFLKDHSPELLGDHESRLNRRLRHPSVRLESCSAMIPDLLSSAQKPCSP